MGDILHFFHSSHTPFLHARGEFGTECLLRILKLQGFERVLDFGCGTGSTLVKIKSRVSTCDLYGYDRSSVAIQKSKQRLRFCGLAKQVTLTCNLEELKQKQGTFDVIYAESVLGILSEPKLLECLLQIAKFLKPGGRFVCNETIWEDSILNSEKLDINEICERNFGIPQCSLIFSDLGHAITIVQKNGFSFIKAINLDGFACNVPRLNFMEYRSRCYSWLGQCKSYFNFSQRKKRRDMGKINKEIFSIEKKYLSGQILEFRVNDMD